MENFSTPAATLVPRVANLATLAVMVAATWWSGVQRPADRTILDATAATTVTAQAAQAARNITTADTSRGTTPSIKTTAWPTRTATVSRDALQPVGYQALSQR